MNSLACPSAGVRRLKPTLANDRRFVRLRYRSCSRLLLCLLFTVNVISGLALTPCAALAAGELTPQQTEKLDEAIKLVKQISKLEAAGKSQEAIANASKVVSLSRDVFGPNDVAVARSYEDLASIQARNGEPQNAKTSYEQGLAIRKKLGLNDAETATALNYAGLLFDAQGDYPPAKAYLEQAVAIRKKLLGLNHADTATSISNLSAVLLSMGDAKAARPFCEQALAIRQHVLGPKHLDTAMSLNNLGTLVDAQGEYAAAKSYYEQALAIRREQLGEKHPTVAQSLNNIGYVLAEMGDLDGAKRNYEQSLAIHLAAQGPKHLETAGALNNLGVLLIDMGDYRNGMAKCQQALDIQKAALGREHPTVAIALNNIGTALEELGNFAAAKPLYEQALSIREKSLGPKHPLTAASLNNLGELTLNLGDYPQAQQLFQRALDIELETLGELHPTTAITLGNLGLTRSLRGDKAAAKDYYQRALAIRKKMLGLNNAETALAISNLSILLYEQGDYAAAKPLIEQALAIRQRTLGPDHPEVARSLNNLGVLFTNLDEPVKARLCYEQALDIRKKVFGDNHPDTASSRHNLMVLAGSQGDWQIAGEQALASRQAVRAHVANVLPALSQQQQLQFLEYVNELDFFAALSLGLHHAEYPPLAALSAEFLANGKAVAQESLAAQAALSNLQAASDPALGQLIAELNAARARLAALAQRSPKSDELDDYGRRFDLLVQQQRKLSDQVNARLGRVPASGWLRLDDVRLAIPKNSMYVDIARMQPGNFHSKRVQDDFDQQHYVAWVIPPAGQGDVQVIDLGPAQPIDDAVQNFRTAFKPCQSTDKTQNPLLVQGEAAAEKQLQITLAVVSHLVLEPLLPHLKDKPEVIISPDASLWLVPWAALPLADHSYAIETYNFRYLVSARDLTAPRGERSAHPPRIFANPNYNLTASELPAALAGAYGVKSLSSASNLLASADLRNRSVAKIGAAPPLPGTAAEAAAIAPSLKLLTLNDPKIYADNQALEGVFKHLAAPRVLVLSTHGYFLPEQRPKSAEKSLLTAAASADTRQAGKDDQGFAIENPLLRCGLLLAGCNNRDKIPANSNLDDGVLTGEEIVGVNLRGTELVVLSSCETGLGQVSVGQGVAGLRQAFQIAGAQSVVATLWQIPDQSTALLMNDFFANLAAGQSHADALRQAQLARIKARRDKYGAAHPLYWAAFTLTGQ